MAIRLRTVDGVRVALCAVESDPMPDDVYLDDADHYALAAKFRLDWQDHPTVWPQYTTEWAAMATQKLRDAKEEHAKWAAAVRPNPIRLLRRHQDKEVGSVHAVIAVIPHGGNSDSPKQYLLEDGTYVLSDHAEEL